MNNKIKKHFENSRFYKNYNNINHVLLKFKKIKNEYNSSKIKSKIFSEKYIFPLKNKYDTNSIENSSKYEMKSYTKILNEKLKINQSIKKYVKYSNMLDTHFLLSFKSYCIKNMNNLIDCGANIHYKDDYALRWISKKGNYEIFKFLLEKGADINKIDDRTIMKTVKRNHKEIIKILIENDILCDLIFTYSCQYGYLDYAKILLEKGIDIHTNYDKAIKIASEIGNIEIVKFLIDNGADIQTDHNYALRFSCYNEHLEIVKILIKNGANIYCNRIQGWIWSCTKGIDIIIQLLIDNGIDICKNIDAVFNFSHINSSKINIIKYLKSIGIEIKYDINKLFIECCRRGELEFVEYLIENMDNIIFDIQSALINAINYGRYKIVNFLISKGANICSKKNDALIWASSYRNYKIAKILIENGSNIHAKNDEALKVVCMDGSLKVVKLLIKNGAKIHTDDDRTFKTISKNLNFDIDILIRDTIYSKKIKKKLFDRCIIHNEKFYNMFITNEIDYNYIKNLLIEKKIRVYYTKNDWPKWKNFLENIKIIKFLLNYDLDYYCKTEFAKNAVILHKLTEFYEKFEIVIDN
jgi:ankyrin repeat protein